MGSTKRSYDTIGNALFTRQMHTDVMNWRRLLILTSKFHMKRSKAIFDWVFSLDPPSTPYQLSFYGTLDVISTIMSILNRYSLNTLAHFTI